MIFELVRVILLMVSFVTILCGFIIVIFSIQGYFDDESDFYCGITNDPETRKSQHENQDHDGRTITRMIAIECKDKDRAADVETKMEDEGFDIGNPPHEANGAAEDSKWVYLYKKPKIVFRPKK